MNKEGEQKRDQKSEEKIKNENSVKITIAKQVADRLWKFVEKVNEGFEAGRVHRQDVASWIISNFLDSPTENDLNSISKNYYDDALMLESMYRQMKETGEIPEFIRDALRKQFQGVPEAPKKNKKALTKEYIPDVLAEVKGVA